MVTPEGSQWPPEVEGKVGSTQSFLFSLWWELDSLGKTAPWWWRANQGSLLPVLPTQCGAVYLPYAISLQDYLSTQYLPSIQILLSGKGRSDKWREIADTWQCPNGRVGDRGQETVTATGVSAPSALLQGWRELPFPGPQVHWLFSYKWKWPPCLINLMPKMSQDDHRRQMFMPSRNTPYTFFLGLLHMKSGGCLQDRLQQFCDFTEEMQKLRKLKQLAWAAQLGGGGRDPPLSDKRCFLSPNLEQGYLGIGGGLQQHPSPLFPTEHADHRDWKSHLEMGLQAGFN